MIACVKKGLDRYFLCVGNTITVMEGDTCHEPAVPDHLLPDYPTDQGGREMPKPIIAAIMGFHWTKEMLEWAADRINAQEAYSKTGLVATCEDLLPLLVDAEKCEASADDGLGDQLRALRRRLSAARGVIALHKEGK